MGNIILSINQTSGHKSGHCFIIIIIISSSSSSSSSNSMFAKVSTDMFTEYLLLGKNYITQIKVSICIHECPYILLSDLKTDMQIC